MSEDARCPECGQFRPAHKYWVDWEDNDFPAIRVHEHDFDSESAYAPDPVTLAHAKAEIIEHFRNIITHAQMRIAETRKIRAADWKEN